MAIVASLSSAVPNRAERISALLAHGMAIISVIVLGLVAANLFWFALYGAASLSIEIDAPNPSDGDISIARFNTDDGPAPGLFEDRLSTPTQNATIAAPESRLDIRLRGVRVGDDPQTGSAIIDAQSGRQRMVRVGDQIANGIRVDGIYADRIVINRQGVRESVYLRDRDRRQARQSRADDGVSDRPQLNALTLRELSEQLDLSAVLNEGDVTGLRVGEDAEGDWLDRLGLQRSDLIIALNDTPLSSPERLIRALNAPSEILMTIERDGRRLTIETPVSEAGLQE